ncbi:MAG: hypothetical protein JOY71_21540 [Acetobacteraceae bacterium]|nr:hypothetical protein [Acetobacteraceae bacterium]MBV8524669.1 hypothetical protein [Acetobacteraceae bacterium]MBV8590393.1 hypothetical protein [Acetobacteraceae bacterium]
MIHRKLIAVTGALTAFATLQVAAAPTRRTAYQAPSFQFDQTTPRTPGTGSGDQSGYTAAPVPDRDARGPQASTDNGARFSPDLLTTRDFNKGDGYLNGSTVQAEQSRHFKPAPGFRLDMPLQ